MNRKMMDNYNEKRSMAEAHLYVAVLKADKKISGRELLEATTLARHSQRCLNILNMNRNIDSIIGNHIECIVRDSAYGSWDWKDHFENALLILRQLRDDGDWSVKLVADKIEDGLRKLSWIDGYDISEAAIVDSILKQLKVLNDENV